MNLLFGIIVGCAFIFCICVIIRIISKVMQPTTMDEEIAEYEALLKKREKRKLEMNSSDDQSVRVPVPILNPEELKSLANQSTLSEDAL